MPRPELVLYVVVSLKCKCYIVWVRVRHLGKCQFLIDVVLMCDFFLAPLDVVREKFHDCAWNVGR